MIGLNFGWLGLFKGLAILAVVGFVGGTVWAGYKYVKDLQIENVRLAGENSTLVANNAQLEQGIVEQQRTIAGIHEDLSRQQQILTDTLSNFAASRNRVRALEAQFAKHNIGFLAANKPRLVENIINNATNEINRCFEIASGAPLTQEEINATLPSQINSECPELANPNFRGN